MPDQSYYEKRNVFNQYVDKYKSPFAACNVIASKARNLAETNNNIVMHSEALSWVLTGDRPKILDDYEKSKRKFRSSICIDITQDTLSLVNDTDVKDAVETSIRQSRREKHLIYIYKDISDIYKQGRVRTLCNIIWDKLQTI